jgi:hypothetical protein
MKKQLSNLHMILIGFIGGLAFLISCGEDSTNDAAAADVPDINDQMFCSSNAFVVDETSTTDTLYCMKQSTKVQQRYKSLAGIYAEGWIMVDMQLSTGSMFLFYK